MSRSQHSLTKGELKEKIINFDISKDEIEKMFIGKRSTKCQTCHKLKIRHNISPYDFSAQYRKYICTCIFESEKQYNERIEKMMDNFGFKDESNDDRNVNQNKDNSNSNNEDINYDEEMKDEKREEEKKQEINNNDMDMDIEEDNDKREENNNQNHIRIILNRKRHGNKSKRPKRNGDNDNGKGENGNSDNDNGEGENEDGGNGGGDNGDNGNRDNNNGGNRNGDGGNGDGGNQNNGNNDFITRQEFQSALDRIDRIENGIRDLNNRYTGMDEKIIKIDEKLQLLLNQNHN